MDCMSRRPDPGCLLLVWPFLLRRSRLVFPVTSQVQRCSQWIGNVWYLVCQLHRMDELCEFSIGPCESLHLDGFDFLIAPCHDHVISDRKQTFDVHCGIGTDDAEMKSSLKTTSKMSIVAFETSCPRNTCPAAKVTVKVAETPLEKHIHALMVFTGGSF